MNLHQSLRIVQTLAIGADPITGELFPSDSPYNHPDVIRALYACIDQAKLPTKRAKKSVEEKREENRANGRPANYRMPWTEAVSAELADAFRAGFSPKKLAAQFERSEGAIVAQLQKQGLISDEEALSLRAR